MKGKILFFALTLMGALALAISFWPTPEMVLEAVAETSKRKEGPTRVPETLPRVGGGAGTKKILERILAQDEEAKREFLALGNFDQTDESGRTPLMTLSYHRELEVVRALLAQGVRFDLRDENGMDALMYALEGGALEVALVLIAAGSEVARRDKSGQSVLHYAVAAGDPQVIKLLLERGADPNLLANEAGHTMLMSLAHEGLSESMGYFLEYGAKVSAQERDGNSVLHHAVMSGQSEAVELALNYGADKDTLNERGERPIDVARRLELSNLVEILQ